MIDLSKNTNPYYPSYNINKHLLQAIKDINIYPPMNNNVLEGKISKYFQINENNIYLAKGTLEAFDTLLKNLKVKKIGFLTPTFWGMQVLAKKNNCELIYEQIDNNYTENQIEQLAKKVDLLYLCNPNNPTLSYINQNILKKLIKNNTNCHFVIDETLLSFSPLYYKETLYRLVNNQSNLSVMISFSKIFSLGGLRIAIMFSNQKNLDTIKKDRLIFSSNILTQYIVDDVGKEYFKIDRKKFSDNFSMFINLLDNKFIDKIINENVSFILIKFKEQVNTQKLIKYLEKNNFLIADISTMYLELEKNWVRISIGKKNDLKKLAKLINKYLEVKYEQKFNSNK